MNNGWLNKYKIILILILIVIFLVTISLFSQQNNNEENLVEIKINGLTFEEIRELTTEEYTNFVSNLSDEEIENVPTKYDLSEYISLEDEDFIIESFDEENKILKVKLKSKNIDKAKQSFEKWYLGNVNNERSEINIVWEN